MGAVSGITAAGASAATALSGDGSTLVAPIEAEWAAAWAQSTGQPQPTYQAVGSGQGLKDIGAKLVDFAGSDAPLTCAEQLCGAVLLYEYRVAGLATGVFATDDMIGVRTVIAPAEIRAEVAGRAIRSLSGRYPGFRPRKRRSSKIAGKITTAPV